MATLLTTRSETVQPPAPAPQELPGADGLVSLLLVDDDPRNLTALASILDSPDYSLVHARTAEEALLALMTHEFAAILLDIRMPGMNGLELAHTIKQRKKTRHIPIIFLTAYYQEGDQVLSGYDAGAVDYLIKPCNPVILRSKVAVFVNLFRKTRALQTEIRERRRLETGIARAIEREQLRLGQELHDGLCQQLAGMSYLAHTLKSKMQNVSPPLARELGRLESLIQKSVDQSRDLAKGFYPVELEKLGLSSALEEAARNLEKQFNITCSVASDHNPLYTTIKTSLAIQLFRIAQEAAHNACKHSQAKMIRICLSVAESNFMLRVEDDGVGLCEGARNGSGMGMAIMHYRAQMVEGVLEIRNGENGGVVVSCTAPISILKN